MVNVDKHELTFSFEQPEHIRVPLLNILQQAEQQGQTFSGMGLRTNTAQHVLIIDPNESRSRYIKHLLATNGYQSVVTTNALDAFTLVLRGTLRPFAAVIGHEEGNDRFFLQRLLTQSKQRYNLDVTLIRLFSQPRNVVAGQPPLNWQESVQQSKGPQSGNLADNSSPYTLAPSNAPKPSSPMHEPFTPPTSQPLPPYMQKRNENPTPAEIELQAYQALRSASQLRQVTQESLPGQSPRSPQKEFPVQPSPQQSPFRPASSVSGSGVWPREPASPLKRAPEMQLPSIEGQELGRYRVGKAISKHVYRTYDRLRENDIALKAYPTDNMAYSLVEEDLELDNIFKLEAKLLEAVKHPHILPVSNTGKSYISGVPFIFKTMPLCAEGSLTDWLWEHGGNKVFTPRDVFPILLQLAEALQFAHENRVLYQNFKFSNLLIQEPGKSLGELHLLLADFAVTVDGSFFMPTQESYPYVAPERWVGRVLPASDQYGLAAMMYELLTGRPPFQKATEQTMKHMHTNMPPQPPSTYNPSLPVSANMVLLKALAKKPEDRFASTLHFAEAFRNYCI